MMAELLDSILWALAGYAGLPTLVMRMGFAGAVRRGAGAGRQVALTFDDGPDPRYTPMVLDVLAKYRAPACFFMLGEQARAHGDLVRQVADEGHEIGVHAYRHRLQAFQTPWSTVGEIRRTADVLTGITGMRPRFLRPPWGVFNLWTALAARRLGLAPVVWSVHPWDWSAGTGAAGLYRWVMRQVQPGGVILLHDGNGPGAAPGSPERMIRALPRVIAGLRRAGYSLVPLSEIAGIEPGRQNDVATPV